MYFYKELQQLEDESNTGSTMTGTVSEPFYRFDISSVDTGVMIPGPQRQHVVFCNAPHHHRQ